MNWLFLYIVRLMRHLTVYLDSFIFGNSNPIKKLVISLESLSGLLVRPIIGLSKIGKHPRSVESVLSG